MGLNTTVVVLNDALSNVENDPEFGKRLARAIAQKTPGQRVDVMAGTHSNAAHVVETHHADQTVLISVGGNLGLEQAAVYGWRHNERDVQVALLKAFAEKLGFKVVPRDS